MLFKLKYDKTLFVLQKHQQNVEYNENKKNLTLLDFTFVFPPASKVPISGGDATQCNCNVTMHGYIAS